MLVKKIKHSHAMNVKDASILNVVMFMQPTWIRGSMWTPDNWSVYRQTVRTNNDVEGWHRRINGRAGRPDLGFYVLVPLLCREAETVDLTIRLVSEHALTWVHRKIFKEVHGRLFKIWEKYEDDDMTTTQLLRACNHIIGLGPSTTQDDIHNEDF
ncbi:uncharacterized protein LOC127881816 isoform X2 [Dreissena polymorpha]|uniref:uncharacterized protein LOC127881816 isoform X2 n=1 Tax=Dreissena polymorpha TaxID=45954 RepID=UPI0022655544|nr:uncharacterized protein LOC127881816 isoform X2 [Dreissena polymorpha]